MGINTVVAQSSNNSGSVSSNCTLYLQYVSCSEQQAIVNAALGVPGLKAWSDQWQYANMDFIGTTGSTVSWNYAVVHLKLPTVNDAPFYCQYGWSAAMKVELQTKQVVDAFYPTIKNHDCNLIHSGPSGYVGSSNTITNNTNPSSYLFDNILAPSKQFKSGIAAQNVKCRSDFMLITKAEDGSPACVKQDTVKKLVGIGWALSVDILPQNISNKMPADTQQQPYADITITGLKENYTLNEPIVFSVIIEGYGTGCGDTQVTITKKDDSQYKSPTWGSLTSCASNAKQNYFKFNAISENTSINQTGNYILTGSFDDLITYHKTEAKKKFIVTLSKNAVN